jgi:hypothetical protein
MEFRFEYDRKTGEQYRYHVTAYLSKHTETGQFAYSAVVHRGADYVGPLARWPLLSAEPEAAMKEARSLMESDIENLVGINE